MTVSGKKGLKEARKQLGLTQAELAVKTGVSQQFISKTERKNRPLGCILRRVRVVIQEEEKRVAEASKHAASQAEIQPSVTLPKGYIEYVPGSCRLKEEYRCVLDWCRSHCPFSTYSKDRPATGV